MKWLLLMMAIVSEVVATSALKMSEGFTKPWPSAIVAVGYGVAFYLLALTLNQIPVGVAYAIWSGVGIVLVSIVGWLAFDQRLDMPGIVGVGLIVAGVAVTSLLSKSAAH